MLAPGFVGASRRKFVRTTIKGSDRQAPDLVDRNFAAERPNLLWVADITYVPTLGGLSLCGRCDTRRRAVSHRRLCCASPRCRQTGFSQLRKNQGRRGQG